MKTTRQFTSKKSVTRGPLNGLSIKDIGELAAIERFAGYLHAGSNVIKAIGDDCAVVRTSGKAGNDLLLTSDAVIEDIHFEMPLPGAAIGHKAIARALSDIAAMGGAPLWALINLVAPPTTRITFLDEIYRSAEGLARKHGLSIVGGDTSKGSHLELHVFAVGNIPKNKSILRSGAGSGDTIFVTGALGGSRKGKHLSFEPRLKEGQFLQKWATSMIDISDGLATDLRHLIDMSRTGAKLDMNRIPISSATGTIHDRSSLLDHALYDGEDFELLFTIPERRTSEFISAWKNSFKLRCTSIGQITNRLKTIECVSNNGKVALLDKEGYQHFKD